MNEASTSWFAAGTSLTAADFLVLVGTLGVMFLIGWCAGRGTKTTGDFFLGGRRIPHRPRQLRAG